MFRQFMRPRPLLAFSTNAIISVNSLVITFAIARGSSTFEFGLAALGLTVYYFSTGLARSTFTETVLAGLGESGIAFRTARRLSLYGLVCAAIVTAFGVLLHNPYLTVLGPALHGLTLLENTRTIQLAIGKATHALEVALGWMVLTVAAAALLPVAGVWLFAAWAASGALLGYANSLRLRTPIRASWPKDDAESRTAGLFAADFVVGTGGSMLTVLLLGLTASPRVVGAVRGAGTLLGPANVISTSARSLVIPLLTRAREGAVENEVAVAIRVSGLLLLVSAPLALLLTLIPKQIGEQLLGATWDAAALAIVPLAIESVLALLGSVPASGHRSRLAGRRSLILRLSIGVPRPFLVLSSAALWGLTGAVWSMAAIAGANLLVWWISYLNLARRSG